jgi:polar amino acid transport system substrate-binding protein
MKKLYVIIFLPLLLFANMFELTQSEREFINANGVVSVALMPDFSPFSYIAEDKVVGFENDLLQLLSQKTGLRFQKTYGVWNKNLQAFKAKKVDMIASISYKSEREPFTNFTSPYYKIPIMIFIRDNFGIYEGLESLRGKKIGILKDVFYEKELREIFEAELTIFETYDEITEALVFGKIDALIQNLPNINYLIKTNLYTNLVLADELRLPGITKEDLRFGINPDKPLLHSIIQKALESMSDKERQELIDRWIDVKYNNLQESLVLNKEERNYLDAKSVTYCIDPQFEPFEFIDKNGNHDGLTKDYLEKIIEKTSMKTVFLQTKNWTQTLEALEQKRCDLILAIEKTDARANYLNFTQSYLDFPQVVAMRSDADFVASMQDLAGKKVAIVKDFAVAKLLQSKYEWFYPIEVANVEEGLKKVANAEIDAFINYLPTISVGINAVATGNIKIAGKIDEKVLLRAAVRADDGLLFSIVQKVLLSMNESEHRAILDKWLTIKYEYGTDYVLVWKVLAATAVLLMLFSYWIYKMRNAKKIIEAQNKQLEVLAMTDKMTGVYNRMKLDELLRYELERSSRYDQSFGCAIIDIDHFKKTNDTYGHLVGDRVLIELASLIQNAIRKTDYFGRWGGEEFLIIAPEVDDEGFFAMLDKIRQTVCRHPLDEAGIKTVSIGATIYRKNDTEDSIIKRADDALYEAKNGGRNKVVVGY